MPRIKKEEVYKPEVKYSLHELLKIKQDIKKAGGEQQWLINKDAIYLSKKHGYEGQIIVKATVDSEGITHASLFIYNEQLKQLYEALDEDGMITIYEKTLSS